MGQVPRSSTPRRDDHDVALVAAGRILAIGNQLPVGRPGGTEVVSTGGTPDATRRAARHKRDVNVEPVPPLQFARECEPPLRDVLRARRGGNDRHCREDARQDEHAVGDAYRMHAQIPTPARLSRFRSEGRVAES